MVPDTKQWVVQAHSPSPSVWFDEVYGPYPDEETCDRVIDKMEKNPNLEDYSFLKSRMLSFEA